MTPRPPDFDERLHRYLVTASLRDDPLQARLREETQRLSAGAMQIAAEQGQFMALLVSLIGARRCIEIGTFTGYSALCTARALPEDGRLTCCDISEEWTSIARRYWEEDGVARKIDLRLGPAAETLSDLLGDGGAGRYDFAFIDADKTGYDGYYERCLELIRPGGLIAIDNMLWNGWVADPSRDDADTEAIRALNLKVRDDRRVDASLVPIGDGLLLARKRGG